MRLRLLLLCPPAWWLCASVDALTVATLVAEWTVMEAREALVAVAEAME